MTRAQGGQACSRAQDGSPPIRRIAPIRRPLLTVSLIRRLFSALSTVAVFVAIGAAIVIVVISRPASYVTPGDPDPSANPGDGRGGPAIENVLAGLQAISPYLPYLSIGVGLLMAVWLAVRLRDRRRLAKRRAEDAFIQIDRTAMGGRSDELIRTWEDASAPQPSRGIFGLFRRRPAPAAVFGEDRPGFFARLFRRRPATPAATPVDPFAPFAPVPVPVAEPTVATPVAARRLPAIIGGIVFFLIGELLLVAGTAMAALGALGVALPTSIATLAETQSALAAAIAARLDERATLAIALGGGAGLLVATALLAVIASKVAGLGRRTVVAVPPVEATIEPADGDPEQPYRFVDLDAPTTTPPAPAASADFAALFDDAIGADTAPQPTARVADFASDGGFTDPAAWGQAAGSASPWQSAARPGTEVPRPEPGSAEITPRPETAIADPDLALYVPRRRHRIELLIGVVAGLLAGVAVTAVDARSVLTSIVSASSGIDPQLLTAIVATVAGAFVALLIVGAVRLLRRPRAPRSADAPRVHRGRAALVAALWIIVGAALIVGASIAIGATDPGTIVTRATAIFMAFDPVTAVVITLIILSFFVGFIGAATATVRRAALTPSTAGDVLHVTPTNVSGRRLVRGVAFLLCLLIAGVIAGAGAIRLGRGIAEVPAASPAASESPSPATSPSASEAPIAEGWTIVEPENGGWRAAFPVPPSVSELLTPSSAGELLSTTYSIAVNGTSYAVIATDYPAGTIDGTNPETIDGAVRGAAEQVSGEVSSTRSLTFDATPGREAIIRAGQTEFRTRIFIRGNRLLQLIVGYRANAAPVEAAAFIDAFSFVAEVVPSPSPSPSPSTTPSPSGSPSGAAPPGVVAFAGRHVGRTPVTAREAVLFVERPGAPESTLQAAPLLPVAHLALARPTTLRGRATYFDATMNNAWYTRSQPGSAYYHQDGGPYRYYAAASPALRAIAPFHWGAPPYRVIVTNRRLNISIVAWVVDECACVGGGIIDLAPEAWWAVGGSGATPFSRGVIDVEVELLSPTMPLRRG